MATKTKTKTPRKRTKKGGRNDQHPPAELLKLDLGCGQNKQQGFTGVDIWDGPGVDVVHDLLTFPWPFEDGTVGEVHCSHFLEHVPGRLRFAFMDELYRVMAPGAKAAIIVPYWTSMRAVQDPTHEWPPFSESSFLYFNREWRERERLDHYDVECDFDYSYGYSVNQGWAQRNMESQQFAIANYVNVIMDLHIQLTKRES